MRVGPESMPGSDVVTHSDGFASADRLLEPTGEPRPDSANQTAEGDRDDAYGEMTPIPHVLRHPIRSVQWLIAAGFGLLNLMVLLAVVAAIPIVNLYALGYFLEVEGRIARSGKIRSGFPLIAVAGRLGAIVTGCWLWLIPVRILANLAADAEIIDPAGTASTKFQILTAVMAVVVGLHLCLAIARGGRLSCFFRPIRNARWLKTQWQAGNYLTEAERHLRQLIAALRFRSRVWLGLRGFIGSLIWLVPPTLLFAAAERTRGGQILTTVIGGVLLMIVLCHLPFMQAQFSAENRFRALFDWRTARLRFRQAPLAFLISLVLLYALATPLYLAKVRLPPQDAMWLLTVVFIASIWPTRLVVGWAYGRAVRRDRPVRRGWIWVSRLLMIPFVSLFVLILFFTQFIDEHGKLALFEHHALLLPVPF